MKNLHVNQKVSLIVPVFNEIDNISQLHPKLIEILKTLHNPYEIIYIDDNSTDGSYEYLKHNAKPGIRVFRKVGKQGKAFSLSEGFSYATGSILAMIDSDLQYPPEALPEMIELTNKHDVVVANRKQFHASRLRKFFSRGFKHVFGKAIFGLNTDVQSGLKVFKREVYATVGFEPKSKWTFDLEFLYKAREAGFSIGNHDITFAPRENGNSTVNIINQSFEIGSNALQVKLKKIQPSHIPPTKSGTMIGAGIGYKRNKYVTHTTIPHEQTALKTFIKKQIIAVLAMLAVIIAGFIINPLFTTRTLIGVLSVVYFIDFVFQLFIILRSLYKSQEIQFSDAEMAKITTNVGLPMYSILCPLYKEAAIVPQFLKAIGQLDWPKEKLDVMLLLEEDDVETIKIIRAMRLPSYVRIVVVPHSMPKTKPKACNYGLNLAKGEYIVIYDAEDIPDPKQLKKAYAAFNKLPENVICLQAKLNYYNPSQNLLTRFFTTEYSLWFDLTLTGFQSINTSIPLGGTSNHFKTVELRKLRGWDTFNVTEDADLGIRLFKQGYTTAVIDSVTLEEANSNTRNWIRQRSRWIKGYMQSYLVHMREPFAFFKTKGIHALLFQLVIGCKLTFIFLNPFLWVTTAAYFTLFSIVGPTIELLYIAPVFYLAATSLIFGNFLFMYYYMAGCAKREQWDLIKYVLLIPLYWLLISIAGWVAFYQLLFKPHYWEKTIHGLHLAKKPEAEKVEPAVVAKPTKVGGFFPRPQLAPAFMRALSAKKNVVSGLLLIAATLLASVVNLVFNVYLGNRLDAEAFRLLSLVSSFLYVASVPVAALNTTASHRSGFLESRYGSATAYGFWKHTRRRTFAITAFITLVWLMLSPLTADFFHTDSLTPLLLFSVVWLVGLATAMDRGLLSGKLLFGYLALLTLVEPFTKVISAFIFMESGMGSFVYTSIPLAYFISFLLGWLIIAGRKKKDRRDEQHEEAVLFPKKFFSASFLSNVASVAFLSLDVLLANHYLSHEEAATYSVLSLVAKMIYFLGSLASQFVIPVVSRLEGERKNSGKTFYMLLAGSTLLAGTGFAAFGIFGHLTLPILLPQRAGAILPYVVPFSIAIFAFTVSRVFVSYYLARKIYTFPVVIFLLTIAQVVLMHFRHDGLSTFISSMAIIGGLNLMTMLLLHVNITLVRVMENNVSAFLNLFARRRQSQEYSRKPAILIFNWRDTKHIWAGGAEVYVQEIAKRWVKQGNKVTLFCGNDGHSPQNQTINGVEVIRRGGTYLVYLWAFLYYIFVFRGKYDIVIDCENGIPFFTPLYVRKPIFLVIHHVHQEVFRQHLRFPFAQIAAYLESKLMPFLYKNRQIVTVSESSKKEIMKLGFSNSDNIEIIYNGINSPMYSPADKTSHPSFVYLGRLKPYKNIDVAVKAFAKIAGDYKNATLDIVGEGESMQSLKDLVKNLNLSAQITFHGKVSERKKAQLLARSWAMVQPSMMEGWGITVIEANVSGTPVIASKVNGLKDSVIDHETGLLVTPGDVKDMARAMKLCIEDPALVKHLAAHAVVWSRNFNWERSARVFYVAIENMLRGKSYSPWYARFIFARSR